MALKLIESEILLVFFLSYLSLLYIFGVITYAQKLWRTDDSMNLYKLPILGLLILIFV